MTQDRTTVFIVDDDASVRKALRRLLRAAGYDVETFDSAATFLQQPAVPRPRSCLVLDIRMPGMSGLELQQTLDGTCRALPIVFMTGYEDATGRTLTSCSAEVLCKPLDERVLLQAIERALGRAQ